MHDTTVLVSGLAMGESPRWHDGRLWLSDWAASELLLVDPDGSKTVVATIDSFPFCIDFLPGGDLLVMSSDDQRLLRRNSNGELVLHADLSAVSTFPWNEVAADGRGNVFVNGIGYDMMGGEDPGKGQVAVVTPDGSVREVAGDLAFPNGMAITPDGSTLVVAESHGKCLTAFDIESDGSLANRRVWAALGGAPDGITLDADGAIWTACYLDDSPHTCCIRVAEGGEVLDTIVLDQFCFSCALGGDDGMTLHLVVADWNGPEGVGDGRTGRVLTTRVSTPAAARP
ncbi:MAG: SMP-30/gluconolactonase/LRE family protein [Acidimicrobiales bacterium]